MTCSTHISYVSLPEGEFMPVVSGQSQEIPKLKFFF